MHDSPENAAHNGAMSGNAEANAAMEAASQAFSVETIASLVEGTEHLKHAARLGHGGALTQLAHFTAAGVHGPADWDKAADMLVEAAGRGSFIAGEELRVVAGAGEGAPSELRQRIDFRAAIAPRPTESLSDAPRIRASRAFMSPAECAWFIERGRARLAPAEVYDQAGGLKRVDERSNSSASFRLLDVDLPLVLFQARMSQTIGLPGPWFEPSTLLHYAPGQCFLPHYDWLDARIPAYAAELAEGGQRIATLLVYLNDGFEGGETDFPKLNFRFKGSTGDLLAFANLRPDGSCDAETYHQGLPTKRGEKWLLSQWVRDRSRH
jgi:hypothetical protein